MTDIATLALRIDATQVSEGVKQLDGLTQAGAKAETSTKKLGVTVEQAERHMKKASIVLGELKREEEAAALAAQKLAQAQQQATVQGQRVTAVTGAQRAGMQQLSYQLGDVATMYAMGARPMQIFASQSGQVIQAVGLMTGGTSKLAGFLGGPWGIAITAATVVLVPLIAKLWESEEALSAVESAAKDAVKAFYESVAQSDKLTDLMTANTKKWALAQGDVARLNREIKATEGGIEANFLNPRGKMELEQRRAKLIEQRDAAKRSAEAAVEETNAAIKLSQILEAQADKRNATTEATTRGTGSSRSHGTAVRAEVTAYDEAVKAADTYILGLVQQTESVGLSAKELRALEAQRIKDAGATEAQRKAIDEQLPLLEKAIAAEEELARIKERSKQIAGLQADIAQLEREAQAVGLVGWERERLLIILEAQAQIKALEAKQADAIIKGLAVEADLIAQQIDLINKRTAAQLNNGDQAKIIDDQTEALRRQNDQWRDMISLLDRIGGFGGVLGSLMAITTGNYNSVASGPGGDLLAFLLNTPTGNMTERNGMKVAEVLGDKLQEVFGPNGLFGKSLTESLQAAGMGYAAANAVGVGRSGASQFLSSAGGLFGEIAGEKFLGKLLGDFAGPVGSILGGIFGGLLGSVFSGPPKGSATLNGLGITGTMGKGDQLSAANQSATGILDTLNRLADALGGTLGSVSGVSIGMRGDEWRVDPSGSGQTKAPGVINFGQDAEAAAAYAIKLLIERGVISGIRASTQNILKAGGDLEEALNKALMWESAFKELESAASPFAAQMKELSDYFKELNEIGKQYGATVEELGKIQELQQLKVSQLIQQASATYRSTFYSDAENVAYAKQQISATLTPMGYGSVDTVAEYKALVEATDALQNPELYGALMELADEFGVLKDAADSAAASAAAEQAKKDAIASQRGQMEVALLRAQGREIEAVARARQLELEALDPSLRGLQEQINKAQDIASARDDLRAAYERESAALQQVVADTEKAVTTWRTFSDSLTRGNVSTANTQSLLIKFMEAAGNADVKDPAKLTSAGSAYLDALSSSATSYTAYQRGVGTVRAMVGSAIDQASSQGTVAQMQLDEMKSAVGQLIDLNENVMSVEEGIAKLNALMGGGSTGGTGGSGGGSLGDRLDSVRDQLAGVFDIFRERFDRQERIGQRNLELLASMDKFFKGITRDGSAIIVQTDSDTPLAVSP